jgi:hypothetical protein
MPVGFALSPDKLYPVTWRVFPMLNAVPLHRFRLPHLAALTRPLETYAGVAESRYGKG